MTIQEILEYFDNKYDEDTIRRALGEIAKYNPKINPRSNEFPENIVEMLEDAIAIAAEAAKKQLGSSPPTESNLALTEQLAIDIARQRSVDVRAGVLRVLLEAEVSNAQNEAIFVDQVSNLFYEQTLAELKAQRVKGAIADAAQTASNLAQQLSNPEKLDELLRSLNGSSLSASLEQTEELQKLTLPSVNIENFLKASIQGEEVQAPGTLADVRSLTELLRSQFIS